MRNKNPPRNPPDQAIGTPATRRVAAVVDRIKPLLAGRPPEEQGAILADLCAIWLAGHCVVDDAPRTRAMREDVLEFHIDLIRRLTDVWAKILGTAAFHTIWENDERGEG